MWADGRITRGSSVSGQKRTVTLGSLLVFLIELVIPRFGSRSSERVFRAAQFGLWVIMWVPRPVKLKALSNEWGNLCGVLGDERGVAMGRGDSDVRWHVRGCDVRNFHGFRFYRMDLVVEQNR